MADGCQRVSYCVGLTGGIASGKSTVAAAFAALGVPWIDADQVAREVVVPGSAGLQAVIDRFGQEMLDANGALDRRRMREHVFGDEAARRDLEALLHPRIRDRLREWRDALADGYGLMVVPILIEGGFDTLVDRVLVVDVPEAVQLDRLMRRDGIDAELARRMIAAQLPRARRLEAADDTVDNSASMDTLAARVAALHATYLRLASAATGREQQ